MKRYIAASVVLAVVAGCGGSKSSGDGAAKIRAYTCADIMKSTAKTDELVGQILTDLQFHSSPGVSDGQAHDIVSSLANRGCNDGSLKRDDAPYQLVKQVAKPRVT